jgi:hypothetical protein
MRKFLTAAAAALTLAGGGLATAQPAAAAPYGGWHGGYSHGGGHWGGGHWGGGGAVAAGILGLAVGAAIASPHYDYGYGPAYYDGGPAYGPGGYADGTCYARQRVWDPYVGGYVVRAVPYAC